MPRPTGAPFWGESRASTWDYSLLAGVSDYWNATEGEFDLANDFAINAVGEHGEDIAFHSDDFARLHSGASVVLMSWHGTTYMETTDFTGWETSWVIRAKGGGTLTLTDDTDPDWDYDLPTANSLGDVAVSGSGWVDYVVPTLSFSIADLMGSSANRLGIVVSGGSWVDIDVVYLRVWPVGGPLGWWESRFGETQETIPQISMVGNGIARTASGTTNREFDPGDDGGAGYEQAWDDMLADAATAPEYERVMEGGSGRGYFATTANTEVISSLGGGQHEGVWVYDMKYAVVNVGNLDAFQPFGFMGTDDEGVDWIRRPDRCEFDLQYFYEYLAPGASPSVGAWSNTDANLTGYRNAVGVLPESGWPTGDDEHRVSINYNSYPYDLPPNTPGERPPVNAYPFGLGSDTYVLNDTSSGGPPTDTTISLSLPLEPKFMLSMGNSFTERLPPQADLTGHSFTGASIVQTATVFLRWDTSESQLIALITFPGIRTWDPYGIEPPPGGGVVTPCNTITGFNPNTPPIAFPPPSVTRLRFDSPPRVTDGYDRGRKRDPNFAN